MNSYLFRTTVQPSTRSPARRPVVARRALRLLGAALSSLVLMGCARENLDPEPILEPTVTTQELATAAGRRVVFAHQSVGNDILDGIRRLSSQNGVAINVVETRQLPPAGAGLFHFRVGENGKPEGKIDDYARAAGDSFAGVDVAMLKLCYIDFEPGTNGRALAQKYADTLQSLQGRYPQTRFVAVTTPLTTIQTGPKAWIKRMLGRQPAGYEVNARRAEFNDEIRRRFAQPGALFDLARYESTSGDTARSFELGGKSIPALDPALTSDGGHLNERGKAIVGAAMVKFLAGTSL